MGPTAAVRIAIVGDGWRAQFFHRIAAALPARFTIVGVVVRSSRTAERVGERWGVACYTSLAELVAWQHPAFVISSAPHEVNAGIAAECVGLKLAVLCETPPARDLEGLRALWSAVGGSHLVQVAEQYHLMPAHAARKTLVDSGRIGRPTSVQLSSTHLYHAVSLIRRFVDAGFAPARIHAEEFVAPLANPLGQGGWSGDARPVPLTTTIATVDFGGVMGLYDFTDNQWHNQLRSRRLVIRGERGEISDDEVVTLGDDNTFVRSPIVRRQLGYDLDLDGYDTEHLSFEGRILWRNPFPGARLSDEEIAIATLLERMARWIADDEVAPYPLAEGMQDQLVALAIERSARSGATVVTTDEPWAHPPS